MEWNLNIGYQWFDIQTYVSAINQSANTFYKRFFLINFNLNIVLLKLSRKITLSFFQLNTTRHNLFKNFRYFIVLENNYLIFDKRGAISKFTHLKRNLEIVNFGI